MATIANLHNSSFVQQASGNMSITITLPTASSWLTVVLGGYYGSAPPNVTWAIASGQGGVTTWANVRGYGTYPFTQIFYGKVDGTPSTTIAVTTSNTYSHVSAMASEWSNVGSVDTTTSAPNSGGSQATPGSITPSVSGELFVAAWGNDGGGITAGPGGSWTNLGTTGATSVYTGLGAYLIETTPVAQNPSDTVGGGHSCAAMVAFKPTTAFIAATPTIAGQTSSDGSTGVVGASTLNTTVLSSQWRG